MMQASEIRQRFLDYFARNGHLVRPSSALVPDDDPTLLFTNAGMVQFKKIFLGLASPPEGQRRATTCQKCVRAGGKHNDLEQVGHSARHDTFFEMLGNFSFGDYFKREAIRLAWEFVTHELAVDPKLLRVSVHHADVEARNLWREIAGLPDSRIYGLSDKDNFWQMAETGPCGPCTEIYIDLAHVADDWRFPASAIGEWTELDREDFSLEAFVEGAEAGRFLEFWNVVFMQFDRGIDGAMTPLPQPSVDTGAGLERIAAFQQRVANIYHTDLFLPLIQAVEEIVGIRYWGRESDESRVGLRIHGQLDDSVVLPNAVAPASFRVLADHARAVTFLLADGVFPSNEGRGYVLRRILRRAVRHAWLLGRRDPTLVNIAQTVIDRMGDTYPELLERRQYILGTIRVEEQNFLGTIGGGLARFDQMAPVVKMGTGAEILGTVSGEDAFRLYDTFGFPIDLTELMASERGYAVDTKGFDDALEAQRRRSQEERKGRRLGVEADALGDLSEWDLADPAVTPVTSFVGYDIIDVETQVTAMRQLSDGRSAMILRESPFYAESGGQISDRGDVVGKGWRMDVEDVKKVGVTAAAIGRVEGTFAFGPVLARVPAHQRRATERNHTATHLLHAALRHVLGESVHQAGSLVEVARLRFDFTHHGPVSAERLIQIEEIVNSEIWRGIPVAVREIPIKEARSLGAMALFGEKYGEIVRVVSISDVSVELCGGTHVRNTSEIGIFKIVAETGVAAGVRRIEAVTARGAYELLRGEEGRLHRIAELVKSPLISLEKRVAALVDERRGLERRLDAVLRTGGDQLQNLLMHSRTIGSTGARVVAGVVRVGDMKELQALGDAVRDKLGSGVGVLATTLEDGKSALVVVVTDSLLESGLRADDLIRKITALYGGRGGGKAYMAQAGIPDVEQFDAAVACTVQTVEALVIESSKLPRS